MGHIALRSQQWEIWARQPSRQRLRLYKTTAVCTLSSIRTRRAAGSFNRTSQYTDVPTNTKIGIVKGASTRGGALLVSHAFQHGFSLAGRGEYISSTGSVADQSVNLIFGPGSSGWSATLTPTFQYERFFVRGDLSWVHASNYTPGYVFGPTGMNNNQPRAIAEIGFLF